MSSRRAQLRRERMQRVPPGMDASACWPSNQAPFHVENPVDNTPVKGFASGLWPPLTGVLLTQYHMKGGF